ncbi:MAG TPA: hypothetical protein VMU30_02180 [Bacteroidota bacterium]|nr:hypothetical protein [Bacteroidota bacterium]
MPAKTHCKAEKVLLHFVQAVQQQKNDSGYAALIGLGLMAE